MVSTTFIACIGRTSRLKSPCRYRTCITRHAFRASTARNDRRVNSVLRPYVVPMPHAYGTVVTRYNNDSRCYAARIAVASPPIAHIAIICKLLTPVAITRLPASHSPAASLINAITRLWFHYILYFLIRTR